MASPEVAFRQTQCARGERHPASGAEASPTGGKLRHNGRWCLDEDQVTRSALLPPRADATERLRCNAQVGGEHVEGDALRERRLALHELCVALLGSRVQGAEDPTLFGGS